MNKTILTLAVPAMLTNVATALFGLADGCWQSNANMSLALAFAGEPHRV